MAKDTSKKLEVEKALVGAVFESNFELIHTLLKENEFLKLNQHQDHSMFQMCLRNHQREFVKIFIAEDATLATKIGYTSAHQYAEQGDLDKLTEALNAQPDLLHATDSYGNTPLHLAATQGNLEIVEYLHAQGASLTALNADKNTPLQLALLLDNSTQKSIAQFLVNQSCSEQGISFSFGMNSEENSINLNSPYGNLTLINQEEWNVLLNKACEGNYYFENKNVLNELVNNGYLPLLQNITTTGQSYLTNNLDFSGVNIEGCKFNGAFSNIRFGASKIVNTQFDHVYFNQVKFGSHTDFDHTSFVNSYFQDTHFTQNMFHDVLLSHTQFENSSSVMATFDTVFVSHSNLLGLNISYPNTQTFNVVLDNVAIKQEATQNIDIDAQILNQNAPVIGLISDPYGILQEGEVGMTANAPYNKLNQYGATTVLLNADGIHQNINSYQLGEEIKSILASVPEGTNIPKYILSQHGENLDKIKSLANDYAEHLDAAWIPGGPDVHPEFYGQQNTQSNPAYDYTREIFEFALIDHMVTNNKPLMGICHGSQITNVYFGGTLKQDVDGHSHIHLVMPLDMPANQEGGVVSDVLSKPIFGVSAHHQSIDTLGEGLQPVAVSGPAMELDFKSIDYQHNIQTVIEASEGVDGKPIMLFQFHPEYNVDDANKDILLKFVDLAKQSKQAHALELNDILVSNQTLFSDNQTIQSVDQKIELMAESSHLLQNSIQPMIASYVPELNLIPEMHLASPVA